jgi:sacsin
MVVQPIRQNGQVQLLTTALKNICRDYPAGGTVLRELLQNADDAGATEVVCNFRLSVDLIIDLIS